MLWQSGVGGQCARSSTCPRFTFWLRIKGQCKVGTIQGAQGGGQGWRRPPVPGQLGEGVLARSHVAIWTPPLKNQQFRVGALPTSSPRPPCRTHGRSELQQADTRPFLHTPAPTCTRNAGCWDPARPHASAGTGVPSTSAEAPPPRAERTRPGPN